MLDGTDAIHCFAKAVNYSASLSSQQSLSNTRNIKHSYPNNSLRILC